MHRKTWRGACPAPLEGKAGKGHFRANCNKAISYKDPAVLASLALPTLLLMGLAVLITRLLELVVPETLVGLGLLTLLAMGLMWGLSGLVFAGLYLWQDARIADLLGAGEGLGHFAALGAKSALIWAPLVFLVVCTAPRRWRQAVW